MKILPPIKPYRVLDLGCGEGKDAVFLAKCDYHPDAEYDIIFSSGGIPHMHCMDTLIAQKISRLTPK